MSMWQLGAGSSTQARLRFSLCGAIPLMKSPRLGSETLLRKGPFDSGPRMPRTLSGCADQRLSDPAPFSHNYRGVLDYCPTGEILIFRSSTKNNPRSSHD